MDASGPRDLRELAADVLERIERADPFAVTRAIELCRAVLGATEPVGVATIPEPSRVRGESGG